MTERIPLDDLTSDQLDQLHDDLDQARTLADPELHGRLTAAIAALGKSETELAGLRAANTRVRALAGRIRQGVPWTANADDIAAHILAALDGDQAPGASRSPAAAETEPNNPRTTLDNPAASSWTPPPPGDRREQLPDHLLALLDIPPYTSTACESADLCAAAATRHPEHADELRHWGDRQRQMCRINNKYTGVNCRHTENEPPAPEAPTLNLPTPNASRIEPDPPIRCLNPDQPKEQ